MAKRYHSMHGSYEGSAGRRKQEMEDGGMIREDHSEVANLPQGVMMKPWPKGGYYEPETIDDTIRGIDRQMDADGAMARKLFSPHKY